MKVFWQHLVFGCPSHQWVAHENSSVSYWVVCVNCGQQGQVLDALASSQGVEP